MLSLLLGLFRLVWLFGKGHQAVILENLALRQQLSIYKRKRKRPRLVGRDRWFWARSRWRGKTGDEHCSLSIPIRWCAGRGSVSAATGRISQRGLENRADLP